MPWLTVSPSIATWGGGWSGLFDGVVFDGLVFDAPIVDWDETGTGPAIFDPAIFSSQVFDTGQPSWAALQSTGVWTPQ